MKKMLCLVLALMLLALCPAMAETALQTMTSPNGDYSFQVPEGYFSMDADLMMTLLSTPEIQQLTAEALGLADASQLAIYFDQVEASNMMIVYSPDWAGNFNVQASEATMTMELMVALKEMFDAIMIQQYVSMGIAEEDIRTMDIQEIAGRKWYGVQMIMAGMEVQVMLTIENGLQYAVTFTGIDADDMMGILESFTIGAPVATTSVSVNTSTETIGQRNALGAARDYLRFTAFSREGLIKQLEYEKYSYEDAVYAVDHCGADWNEQALECAKDYLDFMAFSYNGLVGQLEYEGFTHEQAVYGVDRCGADWNEQAVKCAQSYLEYMSFSRQGLIDQLEYEGFTYSQAVYGVTGVGY